MPIHTDFIHTNKTTANPLKIGIKLKLFTSIHIKIMPFLAIEKKFFTYKIFLYFLIFVNIILVSNIYNSQFLFIITTFIH